jgi:hypothetical protein
MQLAFRSGSLRDLLRDAKTAVMENGIRIVSQKGQTKSISGVTLVWQNPKMDKDSYFYWDKASDDWYQRVFVDKRKENRPEEIGARGCILFPYRYSQRSRFYDTGIGYLLALVNSMKILGTSPSKAIKSFGFFSEFLSEVGELVHLQTVLASLRWLGRRRLEKYFRDVTELKNELDMTRSDTLARVTEEARINPFSRRLVTPSFVYGAIDQGLDSIVDVPCYQFFQVLPATYDRPVSSVHFHRSLNVGGGAQLDFHHDYDWLTYITGKTGRKMGDITMMVGDMHVYEDTEGSDENLSGKTDIQKWLMSSTGGYKSGQGEARRLLTENEFYKRNALKVYRNLLK